jgi:hypothetical protein
MQNPNLDALAAYANEAAGRGFRAVFLKFNNKTGEWTAGRNASLMNGEKLVADIPDLMKGRFRFKDGKPSYAVVRVNDGIAPPQRERLGDTDQRLWDEAGDPWKPVDVMPFFALETRQPFVFSATTETGIEALKSLVKEFVSKQGAHPGQLPVIKLGNDSFVIDGRRVYLPTFEIVGMVERPSGVARCLPPAMPALCAGAPRISQISEFGSSALEQDRNGNQPPRYSNDELDQVLRESDEIYGRNDEV